MTEPSIRQGPWPAFPGPTLDWLVHGTTGLRFVDNLFAELCERLLAEGLPLDRASLNVRVLHPQFMGVRMMWWPGLREAVMTPVEHGMLNDARFVNSPIRALYEGAEAIRQRLDVGGDDEFGIYADLRAEGFTDYVALPFVTTDEKRHASTWSTKRPGGFTTEDLLRIDDILPVLTMAAEIRINRRLAKNLLNTYVGDHAGERVLAGEIIRGAGTTIRAAVWYCDLRGSTALSERLPTGEMLDVLNDFFDTLGDPIARHGGEILKFIGDGMLAVFPLDEEGACVRALRAAVEARRAMLALNERRAADGRETLGYGLALHVGELMFGNIGTATRLDFTVIGPAVNTTSRLEGLTKVLHRRVLLSAPFAYACGCAPEFLEDLGQHPLRGVGEPLGVFGLVEDR
jgi:adenylate cyclase